MRVEPVRASGPTLGRTSTSHVSTGSHGVHRRRHGRIFHVDQVHDFERRRNVDALGAGIALLGEPRVAVVGRGAGHEGCRMAPKLDVDPNSGQRAQFGMRRPLVLSLLLLGACARGTKPPETIPAAPTIPEPPALPTPAATPAPPTPGPLIAAAWPLGERVRPVEGTHGVVVSSHQLASDVGVDILRRGGNAVDAAGAVAFALAVVHRVAGSIGGGGFMMIRMHGDTVRALDFRETAPSAATRDMYIDSAGVPTEASLTGPRSVGVPSTVAGMLQSHRRFGHLPWKALITRAVQLAGDGHALGAAR